MDINNWDDTWGTIDWREDPKEEIIQKITDLYHAGVDFNMKGIYDGPENNYVDAMPVCYATAYSPIDIIDLLINGGADINLTDDYGFTPLHWAAKHGKAKTVDFLIKCGPRNYVNKQDNGGSTALHWAYHHDHTAKTAEALIKAGADVNIKDDGGNTALHGSALGCRLDAVKALIKAGADVNAQNDMNYTALHNAAIKDYVEMVETLIKAGVDVNIKNKHGETALHQAVDYHRVENVKALIEAGADVNIKDKKGKTALDLVNKKITNREYKWCIGTLKEIKKLIENADKIRADYLKKHPKKSLQQTLKKVSQKSKKKSLIKDLKERN